MSRLMHGWKYVRCICTWSSPSSGSRAPAHLRPRWCTPPIRQLRSSERGEQRMITMCACWLLSIVFLCVALVAGFSFVCLLLLFMAITVWPMTQTQSHTFRIVYTITLSFRDSHAYYLHDSASANTSSRAPPCMHRPRCTEDEVCEGSRESISECVMVRTRATTIRTLASEFDVCVC